MTDERRPKMADLELNKETLQDLAESEAEDVVGGRALATATEAFTKSPKSCVCGDVG